LFDGSHGVVTRRLVVDASLSGLHHPTAPLTPGSDPKFWQRPAGYFPKCRISRRLK
jgi:hypothetical protein